MFVFNRPLSAVAAGVAVAWLIVCLDRLSHPLEAPHDARAAGAGYGGFLTMTGPLVRTTCTALPWQ